MSEPISGCENICRDFSWVAPLFSILADLGTFLVGLGVILAWRQLHAWRGEKVATKKAELGEELIALATTIFDSVKAIRSPIGYGPPEGEKDDGTFDYFRRLEEMAALNSDFGKLRLMMIRAKAHFGDQELLEAIDAFFKARTKLRFALEGQIRAVRREADSSVSEYSERDAERNEKRHRVIWQDGDEDDPIEGLLSPALKKIEDNMIPHIRLEAKQ